MVNTYPLSLEELRKTASAVGIRTVILGGRETVNAVKLDSEEIKDAKNFISYLVSSYSRISPKLASLVEKHSEIIVKAIEIYKAIAARDIGEKRFAFPPRSDTISAAPISPQFIRYVATASADDPAYSDYPLNSFDLSLSAGTPRHLYGTSTDYWSGKSKTKGPIMHVIFEDGIIEIGSTPKIIEVLAEFEDWRMLGALWEPYIVREAIEVGRMIYQYQTPGVLFVLPDRKFRLGVMPDKTGTSTVIPVGIALYYVENFKSLTWIS